MWKVFGLFIINIGIPMLIHLWRIYREDEDGKKTVESIFTVSKYLADGKDSSLDDVLYRLVLLKRSGKNSLPPV